MADIVAESSPLGGGVPSEPMGPSMDLKALLARVVDITPQEREK
jgi:hypothetical protein